jgi:voltage-gated potassium channel Kch
MDSHFTRKDEFRYAFDAMMSRGTAGLIIWLGVLSAVLILVFSTIILFTGIAPESQSFPTLLWMSLMRTMDPGTIGGDQGGPGFLFSMLLVTFSGIFIFSALIGILTTGLEARLNSLRKGRSRVVETGHTVILGWSEQVFTIVSELSIANENQKNPCVAIMADKDKVDMEDEIKARVPNTKNTKIVCRTGKPIEPGDLEMMSLHTSKSIIILSPDSDDPDPEVIKTMLAITSGAGKRAEPVHMVALVSNPGSIQAARMVGGDQAEVILAGDIIARMAAQTCLQSGLSVVYQELLDYDGDEIYFQKEPLLTGNTFRDILLSYRTSSVIGLKPQNAPAVLNPPMDTVVSDGDLIIAVSEDDDTVVLSHEEFYLQKAAVMHGPDNRNTPRKIIMLGWNWKTPIIIRELSKYVKPGSSLLLVADDTLCRPEPPGSPANLDVVLVTGNTTDRSVLESLSIQQYDHIILLSYSDSLDVQAADSSTLMTLLHLRDIANKLGQNFSLISEMRDVRNRNLAEITGADDYIMSDQILSLLLTQISENKNLSTLFWDLFDPEGSEIYLKPVQRYVSCLQPVNFYTVVHSASELNEIAFGYRISKHKSDPDKAYGITVNPDKAEMVQFSETDMIIVLAED